MSNNKHTGKAMRMKHLMWCSIVLSLICACGKGIIENDTQYGSSSIQGRWRRYGRCNDSLFMGISPFFSFWFKSDSFRYNGSATCGAKASYEFSKTCGGDWYIRNDSLVLSTDSVQKVSVRTSSDNDTLYMNGISYTSVPACFIIEGYADGMVLRGRLGANFSEAVDSLLQIKAEKYMVDLVSYDSSMFDRKVLDTAWNEYVVPVYRVCFYEDSSDIFSCEDAIDSMGNWYRIEFLPD